MNLKKTYVSPDGIIKYAHISKPNTKFDEGGVYTVDLVIDEATKNAFEKDILALTEAAKQSIYADPKNASRLAKIKKFTDHSPIKAEEDEEGNETGNFIVKFKAKATYTENGVTKPSQKPAVVDAKKKTMNPDIVGRGSKVKVAFRVTPFANDSAKSIGISLRLSAVQVLELVQFGGGGADAFGEEEGYEAEEETTTAEPVASGAEPAKGDF